MKRILTAILAAALLLSLCACGKNVNSPGKNEPGATAAPGLTASSVAGEPAQTAPGEASKDASDASDPAEPEDDPGEEEIIELDGVPWPPPEPTGTPDGQPVTKPFMAEDGADYSEALERLWTASWTLKKGDYYDRTVDPLDRGTPNPSSTVTFRRDMTAHFTFNDGCYPDVDVEAYYAFDDADQIMFLLPDIQLPVFKFHAFYQESLAFAFDSQGRLWALFEPEYPIQNFFIGLYEPS